MRPRSWKGKTIKGLNEDRTEGRTIVFHCGTKEDATFLSRERELPSILTAGGRVLSVTGLGATLREAVDNAYARIADISFDGMFYRKDIAHRAFERG